MQITYHVALHDGGWAYRVGDVWSEAFISHKAALHAARDAARRQRVGDQNTVISYQDSDGAWITENEPANDRPTTDVVDDG